MAIGFDDSVHGVTAVHRAGMFAVGITTGQTETELIAAGANLCCMDFTDPKLLQNLESHIYFILFYFILRFCDTFVVMGLALCR